MGIRKAGVPAWSGFPMTLAKTLPSISRQESELMLHTMAGIELMFN
jgi:hypothetical protein